jgi:hypothetical protein
LLCRVDGIDVGRRPRAHEIAARPRRNVADGAERFLQRERQRLCRVRLDVDAGKGERVVAGLFDR